MLGNRTPAVSGVAHGLPCTLDTAAPVELFSATPFAEDTHPRPVAPPVAYGSTGHLTLIADGRVAECGYYVKSSLESNNRITGGDHEYRIDHRSG